MSSLKTASSLQPSSVKPGPSARVVRCFNPRYGRLGLLSFPYWLFYELLAPLVEFTGVGATLVLAPLGGLNVPMFLALLGFMLKRFTIF